MPTMRVPGVLISVGRKDSWSQMNFFKKMINTSGTKNALSSMGIETKISEEMSAAQNEWKSLYSGGGKLSLASAICSETARLAALELKSEISGGVRAAFLNTQYKKVLDNIRNITELACAHGGLLLKPYVAGGQIKVDCIQADNFVPTEYSASGEIVGAAFLDRHFSGGKVYTRIEQHGFEGGVYKIRNTAFCSDNVSSAGRQIALSEVDAWKDIEPLVCIKGLNSPLFVYLKMPMANYIDASSPLGISVFSRVTALIKDAEEQYERLLWEFESGERALYVDEGAMRRDRNGNRVLPDKRLYRLLNSGDDALFKDWTPNLRDESLINGLNEILRRIEFNCGLAYGTLSDVLNVDRTAEEIRVSKQRSYAHVCEIQTSLRTALSHLAEVMNTLCDLYGLASGGDYGISFEGGDGIIADRAAEFEERLKLLREGIIEPWEMRRWYLGEDENVARQMADCATNSQRERV